MTDKKPEWLTYSDDGTAIVKLSRPLVVAGTSMAALSMREPDVNDQLAMDAVKGGDGQREINLFSNLCEVPPADMQRLKLRDWGRLQRAFQGFTD